jgi:hypothetical protein
VAFYQQKSLLIILTSLERSGEGSVFNLKAVVVAVGGGVALFALPKRAMLRHSRFKGAKPPQQQQPQQQQKVFSLNSI